MTALSNFTPVAATVVKLFAYALRAAPTADIVVWGANELNGGRTPGSFLDLLFNLAVPQSPFTAYATSTTNTAFCTALVDNFSVGTAVSAATKAAWVAELTPLLAAYKSRGDFVVAVSQAVDNYSGSDANVLLLKTNLAARAEKAAVFAQSPAGAVYDGHGWAQLNIPLVPAAEPTYGLTSNVSNVNEGGSITFTLQTTNVAAGTTLGYTLTGTGITPADFAGGALVGSITINSAGTGTATITLTNDLTTEGTETLRLALAGGLGQVDVVVNDSSITPAPLPTYALSTNGTSRDEGSSVVYTLATSNVAAGTSIAFTLSGVGITAADVVGGQLSGFFTVDGTGQATATVGLVADVLTEGAEVLRLQLSGNVGQVDTTVNDTSRTPAPVGTADTVLIADSMSNSNAHAPGSAAEGEIPLNTYLNADLLNQAGVDDVRMTIAALKATGAVAGAPLNMSNQSADRGNIAQLSNQSLFSFDLGAQIDRVDYSAESGKIVAVVTVEAASDTQFVLVNDNATDNNFGGATDRMDTLKNVEEIVASAGGGVLDLSYSGRDWLVTFSRGFNAAADVDVSKDRATHRVDLSDLNSGVTYGRSYLEFRDAGLSASVTQATAVWATVQGSDRNETLVFTGAQSLDARLSVLRGGNNAVKFNELTRSILVDVSVQPWVASTNLADDGNSTGQITATTTFTNGDGVTPLSGNTTVTTSHTPDNNIAAGMLKIVGSQDAEDALSFSSTPLPKLFTLGQTLGSADGISVRLVAGPVASALEITGFEFLRDNGASDDVYVVDNIFKATQGSPKLQDGAGNDHDVIKLANEALGSAAVGGAIGAVNLGTLNGPSPGFAFDFDVLDLSAVTATGLQAVGTAGVDDELVVGALGSLSAVSLFESLILTRASTDKGAALTFDLDAGLVKAGASSLFTYAGTVLSAGGLVFGSAGQQGSVLPMDTGLSITVVDTTAGAGATVWGGSAADLIIGAAGNDVLRGGGGNDTLDGGVPAGSGSFAETWAFKISGTPDAVAAAGMRITIAMTIDGAALTLSEAAVVDNVYGDGNGAVLDGASTNTIGVAMAALINANLAAINAGAGTGTLTGASFDATSGTVLLSFMPGVNANDVVTFVLNSGAGPDSGNFALSAGVNVNGGNGGADTFIFESTAARNGHDILLNFTPQSDKLDVSAFAGAAISAASPSINAAIGGTLAGVATTAEFIYNRLSGAISTADFATGAAAGKLVLADGAKCVVAVSADPTGARGDASNTSVALYYVENGPAVGLGDLQVSLVGTINGPVELTLSDIFWALS